MIDLGDMEEGGPGTGIAERDAAPENIITADQVRLNRELTVDACQHNGAICCDAKRLRWVIEQAIKHPGASSTLRAVLEAAVEPWPASATT